MTLLLVMHVVKSHHPELLKWCVAIGVGFGVPGFFLSLAAWLRTWR